MSAELAGGLRGGGGSLVTLQLWTLRWARHFQRFGGGDGDEDGVGLERSGWGTSVRWPCWARTDGRVCALHCMGVGGGGGQSMLTGARSHRVAPCH